jgi:diguanylate cyclase (GGDEF)-like protein
MFWRRDNWTVGQQFALATGLLCLAMVAGLGGLVTFIGRDTTDRLVRRDLTELADTMLDNLHRGTFEQFRHLRAIAEMEATTDILSIHPDKVQIILERLHAASQAYSWIGLADPDGMIRAATNDLLENTSAAGYAWFRDGMSSPTIGDVGELPHLSGVIHEIEPPLPHRYLSLSVPVRKGDGTLVGVLGAHVDWAWADSLRHDFLTPKNDHQAADIWVLARDGTVLLGAQPGSRPLSAEQLSRITATPHGDFVDEVDGGAVLTGFAVDRGYRNEPGMGWIVLARRPAAHAFAPVHRMVATLVGLGIIIAIMGVLLSGTIARRLAAPIHELMAAAGRIGRDHRSEMFPHLKGSVEIVRLSSVLRALLCRIGFAEQETKAAENRAEAEAQRLTENIDSLRRLAETDPLTGLLNRRTWLALAESAAANAPSGLGVLMIDIDHFKSINDGYGHAAGDAVIRSVAELLTGSVDNRDPVARFGGEEFIVLWRGDDTSELAALGERMRHAIASTPVRHGDDTMTVTVSCGIALTSGQDRDIPGLIERADAALYMAKNGGRNRIAFAPARKMSSRAAA